MVDIGAGGHQVTPSQVLVKVRIVSSVELIDGKFLDRVASAGAVSSIPVALVRYSVLQIVGPAYNQHGAWEP